MCVVSIVTLYVCTTSAKVPMKAITFPRRENETAVQGLHERFPSHIIVHCQDTPFSRDTDINIPLRK